MESEGEQHYEVQSPRATFAFIDQPWSSDALCAETDPEAFFPDRGKTLRTAKEICTQCSAREGCLYWALTVDEKFGVWGGLTEKERRKLARAHHCPDCDRTFSTFRGASSHAIRAHSLSIRREVA